MSDALFEIPFNTPRGEQKTLADFDGKAVLVLRHGALRTNTTKACQPSPSRVEYARNTKEA